ncbi:transcription antitermination factor NusB [Coprobacter fastidiosus]|jgi:transcription antitermination factor nusB|uniref:NusB antitermination factor n=2 Tax=Coprobacter fastidiosus TaxID=1099853 RepID=A0A495WK71_9BACT|nr:transcription antitermination factor NusB [Coprobacter fastidiosus]MBS6409473.1 transcription antitermination factor NusB [Tannerella sp.]CDD90289.1 transcription antitermination factor NusB [Tannerella sp. CAG:51]ERM89063.1 nitrogen utilization substance protein [Coprobacter fastidiosus NSB1 = JCM 33896]RKT61494.1 NusB antitermination factor [Coprobacter fastidiosus NSB1 = JCM 33896]BEG61566.1 transcription antitermination factor NusB [Coprobacter fastidiosus]
MVNRILIRIKVVQIVYSYLVNKDKSIDTSEKELFFSLEKAYELYHRLLLLMIELTDAQNKRIENARFKYTATAADKNPDTRLINNRFIAQLRENKMLKEYVDRQSVSWVNEPDFIRILLDRLLASDLYKTYLTSEEDSYAVDQDFWKKAFKHIIVENEDLSEILEAQSLYWNDDLETISTFVLKTIKRFDQSKGAEQELLPMFKDDEDAEFAKMLFRKTLMNVDVNKALIDQHTKNWEIDRVAFMDIVIMLVAIAEIKSFPTIPVKVTLNEYIEIAKAYSTIKSGHFINGILDAIASQLKKDGSLVGKV